MPTKQYTVQNKAVDPNACAKALQAASWPSGVCVTRLSSPPVTFVTVESTDPDPTSFVQSFQSPAKLKVSSNAPLDPDGVPTVSADGVATQVITISTVDQFSGQPVSSSITVLPVADQGIPISPKRPQLSGGTATITVGPSSDLRDIGINFRDQAGVVMGTAIVIRFD
jgi:hypothetical protein